MSLMILVISISPFGFMNCYFACGFNHMWCDLVGPFPQSAFRQCCIGCCSNRLCLGKSLEGEVIPHLHDCIIVGVFSHVLIFYFIICVLEDSRKYHKSSLTIFSSTWYHIKGGSCFYYVASALVLVLRRRIWKVPCEINLLPWY